jgi:putative ABC transport system permease protein
VSAHRVLRWILRAVAEPGVRADLLDELDLERQRLEGELGPAAADRWTRTQLVTSIWPLLMRRIDGVATKRFWRAPSMNNLAHDIRFALRSLIKRPGFTVIAVLTMALGIGANVAIFSLVNGVFLRGIRGLTDTEGLVEINRDVQGRVFDMSYPVVMNAREVSETLDDLAAASMTAVSVGGEGEPTASLGMAVTGNYFDVLRVTPSRGRFFAPDESFYPTAGNVVVISHGLWQRRLGGDPEVVGRMIRINGQPLEVIGVTPEGFAGSAVGVQIALWIPIGAAVPGLPHEGLDHPFSAMFEVIGRLRPGRTAEQAAEELSAISGSFLHAASADFDASTYRSRVVPWAPVPAVIRGGVTAFFVVLAVIVGLVLTMACTNVANMILARATQRHSEIAVRLALGAGRWRIVRLLLTESVVLCIVAGVIGVAVAAWAMRLLLSFQPPLPAGIVVELDLGLDARVLIFALAVSILTGLVAALAPALKATRSEVVLALKNSPGVTGRTPLRNLLVGLQMAATVVLLVAAGLFARSLKGMESLDPGWHADGVAVMDLDLELLGYGSDQGRTFYRDLLDRVRGLPDVTAASLAAKLPLAGRSSFGTINVAGFDPPEGLPGFDAYLNRISDDYFATLSMDLLQGRDLEAADGRAGNVVAVINRAMANRYWPNNGAVGQRFVLGAGLPSERSFEVVGVVEDAKYNRLIEETPNFYYIPWEQFYSPQMTLQVQSPLDVAALASQLREVIRAMAPDLPMPAVLPLEQRLQLFFLPQRIAAWISGAMGLLGLALGGVGVYGVTAFAMSQRSREMGLRMALGAKPGDVVRYAVRSGLVAPLAGMAAGMAVAVATTRFLSTFLAVVSPWDPLTLSGVILLLGSIAAIAAWVPARRAARLDPAATLRAE